jgi:negative regulator of sigma E activity
MTDTINDQISAFIDDELSADEAAFLVRRFERDPDARACALRYTMIGSALRGELLDQGGGGELRLRVAAALKGASPAQVAARAPIAEAPSAAARFARPALGLGIAAAVAVVAIGTLRMLSESSPASAPAAALPPIGALQADEASPPGYVVPRDVTEAPPLVPPPIRLTNYLMHHSEYASGFSRTSVSSNVVGATVDPAPQEELAEPHQ